MMFNSEMPSRAELPTTKQLLRSTIIALCVAIILLVTVILPAEYAIDPTGVGRMLGLTEMGEIKAQLAQEAEEDKAASEFVTIVTGAESKPAMPDSEAMNQHSQNAGATETVWKDKTMLALKPGQGAEVKLVMAKGQTAQFQWTAKGGVVNYDKHGDGNGKSTSYKKGRGVASDEGDLVAAFTGNHGWFFRNRNDNTVMVILRTSGEYVEVKRVL